MAPKSTNITPRFNRQCEAKRKITISKEFPFHRIEVWCSKSPYCDPTDAILHYNFINLSEGNSAIFFKKTEIIVGSFSGYGSELRQLIVPGLYVGLFPLTGGLCGSTSSQNFHINIDEMNYNFVVKVYYQKDEGLVAESIPLTV